MLATAWPQGGTAAGKAGDFRAPVLPDGPVGWGSAPADEAPRQRAVDACLNQNEFRPAGVVQAVADGMGDWLVWLQDSDGGLWSCNADGAGVVYANVMVPGDLLDGNGAEFLRDAPKLAGSDSEEAEARARDLCFGVAGLTQEVQLIASTQDGLGDTLVWLRMADGQLWMCDASADAQLFVFEPVGVPLDEGEDVPVIAAEAAGE
jgi:hypothetical protein